MPGTARTTLADIAERTGVSMATVSKVVNGRDDVASGTRSRVLAALRESGYRSPGQRKPRLTGLVIDVLVDALNSAYSTTLLSGVITETAALGVDAVVGLTGGEHATAEDMAGRAQRMVEGGRSGLIVSTSAYREELLRPFEQRGLPIVVVDLANPPPAGVTSIGATNWAGGREAAEHLIALGHTRIAFVGGTERSDSNQARFHGFLAALSAHGLTAPDELVSHGSFRKAFGETAGRRLLDLPTPPTAVFCANDRLALGVMAEARRRGVGVPRRLSVVGFDGTYEARQSTPALTSVTQPLSEMGATAVRVLTQRIEGNHPVSHRLELATELVVRETTAPPG
ncbi:LacI family DNA-binding transcriptional regulator [Pseudonocardia sp. TRM90224]|uniref:LacI family DNA-binding transcriptional regulator n=1 Tax=Pseudonocardia sp. TRM90224 TaxID=2812678 RepID=UPI0027DF8BF6|nr:substrate-binding domain-containing protein [Pseudonocardia sp. TRM90224]